MSDYTSNFPAGQYRIVDSVEQRDAILETDRVLNMIVDVRGVPTGGTLQHYEAEKIYQLVGGLGNTYWQVYTQPPTLGADSQ